MTAAAHMPARQKFMPPVRIWGWRQIAEHFGCSVPTFKLRYPRLVQLGMPHFDEAISGFDSKAIEAWLDRRAALDSNVGIEAEMLEAARGKDHA